ncbi:MAG: type I-C CRISPR-associated endonuclease Cas1c [Betaproteobacteria bacterium]
MHQILNTLYITTPNAYAHLENATLRIDVDHEKKLAVPLHHLGSVVCFGNIMVSPALMHRLAEEGKSLVLLDNNGRFKARLEGPVSGNILLRQAQHRQAGDSVACLDLARAFIAGKLKNSRQILLRGARETSDAGEQAILSRTADNLAASLRSLPQVTDLDTLRGIEGEAARGYFGALNLLVRPDYRESFQMDGRSKRPPRDRMNALLSFLYSMLTNDCRSAVESVGLDPQLGFLHVVRPGRAALALDLVEEFRAYLADRLALTLVNRGQIDASGFEMREGGAVQLQGDARKAVVIAYQERKQEEITHPLLEQKMPLGLVPLLQARLIARTLRGDMESYVPFLVR